MAFTVEDLRDLAELLRAHPEWREPLWALLASEEVRRMPERMERSFQRAARLILALYRAQRQHYKEFVAHRAETDRRFAELAEAQRRTEESLRRLAEEFAAHRQEFVAHRQEFIAHRQEFIAHRQEFLEFRAEVDRRFAELAEAQRRHYEEFAAYRAETDRRFAELAEALRILTERVDRMERRQEDHSRDLGRLKSMRLEALYREDPGLFRPLLRRAAVVPSARKMELLEEAEAAGRITAEEVDRAAPLDALVEGFHRREDRRVYLAVEISWQGTTKDVARAVERAAVFARALGAEVIPVVAAKELTAPARRMARARGVWWLQDGRAFAPQEIPEEGPGEDDVETPT
jgi:hypothetical protein